MDEQLCTGCNHPLSEHFCDSFGVVWCLHIKAQMISYETNLPIGHSTCDCVNYQSNLQSGVHEHQDAGSFTVVMKDCEVSE